MHETGSLICNQHDKLMVKMTLFLLCSFHIFPYISIYPHMAFQLHIYTHLTIVVEKLQQEQVRLAGCKILLLQDYQYFYGGKMD